MLSAPSSAGYRKMLLPRQGAWPLAIEARLIFAASTRTALAGGGAVVTRLGVHECARGGFAAAIRHDIGVPVWRHAVAAPTAAALIGALWAHAPIAIGVDAARLDAAVLLAWRALLARCLAGARPPGGASP